jgi:hypothetical protein
MSVPDVCDLCGDPLTAGQEYVHPECVEAWERGDEDPPEHHVDGRPIENTNPL